MAIKSIVEAFVATLSQDSSLKDMAITAEWPTGRTRDTYPAITVAGRGYSRANAGMGSLLFASSTPGETGTKIDTDIHIRIMAPADYGGLYLEDVLDKIMAVLKHSYLSPFIMSMSAAGISYDASKEVLTQILTVKYAAIEEGLP